MSKQIDPRGQQFAAALTSTVLVVVLLGAPRTVALALLALQAAVFGIGVFAGVNRTPYALVYASLIRPRLGPPAEMEDATPPRFAQGVGLTFVIVALVGFLTGLDILGFAAAGMALAAAFLNAATGFCLGCEVYLLIARTRKTPQLAS